MQTLRPTRLNLALALSRARNNNLDRPRSYHFLICLKMVSRYLFRAKIPTYFHNYGYKNGNFSADYRVKLAQDFLSRSRIDSYGATS